MAKKQRKSLAELTTNKPEPVEPAPATEKKGESPALPGTQHHSKGYVTTEGVKKYRVSIHLTKEQRQRLKDMAFEAEQTVTDYIVSQLGL